MQRLTFGASQHETVSVGAFADKDADVLVEDVGLGGWEERGALARHVRDCVAVEVPHGVRLRVQGCLVATAQEERDKSLRKEWL